MNPLQRILTYTSLTSLLGCTPKIVERPMDFEVLTGVPMDLQIVRQSNQEDLALIVRELNGYPTLAELKDVSNKTEIIRLVATEMAQQDTLVFYGHFNDLTGKFGIKTIFADTNYATNKGVFNYPEP